MTGYRFYPPQVTAGLPNNQQLRHEPNHLLSGDAHNRCPAHTGYTYLPSDSPDHILVHVLSLSYVYRFIFYILKI